jgi:diadenosine tetraphosphatase ApaH/serine/threonine PP2A family protein phosphatase
VVPPDSHEISRAPCYLGYHSGVTPVSRTGLSPATAELSRTFRYQPSLTRDRFSLFRVRSPLLAESLLLSLPAGTEMFHFPALPQPALCVQAGATAIYGRRVSPFGNPRITVWLPTPRGLSQAPTSFIGSWCQGIHRAPLITWQTLQIQMLRVHYAVLKIRTALSPRPPQ